MALTVSVVDTVVIPEPVVEEALPCPAPECTFVPEPGDRYCDGCGTWLGLEGEKPPSTGPLKKAIQRNSGALKLQTIVERVEGKLNDWCD